MLYSYVFLGKIRGFRWRCQDVFGEPQVFREVQPKVFGEPANADRKRTATNVIHIMGLLEIMYRNVFVF